MDSAHTGVSLNEARPIDAPKKEDEVVSTHVLVAEDQV